MMMIMIDDDDDDDNNDDDGSDDNIPNTIIRHSFCKLSHIILHNNLKKSGVIS